MRLTCLEINKKKSLNITGDFFLEVLSILHIFVSDASLEKIILFCKKTPIGDRFSTWCVTCSSRVGRTEEELWSAIISEGIVFEA